MTKAEVESIMGAPIKSDFYKNVEEWFYCKTGQYADDHIALFFHEGLLIAKKTIPLLQQTPKEPMVLVRNS
jgi:outer membrane protein assembly factor BamE (lipoprotein component of BamABCDE complex)